MKKHYVTFLSPGTFVSESRTEEIPSWDVELAKKMARGVTERHNAKPYGFRFSTKERGDKDWEPKQTAQSGIYWLGGVVETLAQIKAKNDPKDSILISNMEINGYDKVITNTNSWRFTYFLDKDDVVLDWVQ